MMTMDPHVSGAILFLLGVIVGLGLGVIVGLRLGVWIVSRKDLTDQRELPL